MTQSNMVSEAQALIQAGNAALRAGDTLEASKRFRRATELEPENVAAWLGLASAVRSYREKQELLEQALAIDPTNVEAVASLAYVQEKLAGGAVLAPRGDVSIAQPTAPGTGNTYPATVPAPPAVETTFCYRHPDRETGLRCIQCGRPICTECVRPAFVGQLCPECARERRPRNYQVTINTLVVAGVLTLLLALGISYLAGQFLGGFFAFFIAFILAPVAAELIVRLLDRVTQAKRGKEMQWTVGISYAVGAAPWLVLPLLIGWPPLSLLLFTG
ncbi:MAG: hypothetical protein HC887_06250, partial [Desulfobacteraceae bacterium]|nr:hypothetical protein [Desulfobacteraceae bacterium]